MRTFLLGAICLLLLASSVSAEDELFKKAMSSYWKKDFKSAVRYLKDYIANKPDADAYYFLGYAYYRMKDFEESERYFKEVYLLDPEFTPNAALGISSKKIETDKDKAVEADLLPAIQLKQEVTKDKEKVMAPEEKGR